MKHYGELVWEIECQQKRLYLHWKLPLPTSRESPEFHAWLSLSISFSSKNRYSVNTLWMNFPTSLVLNIVSNQRGRVQKAWGMRAIKHLSFPCPFFPLWPAYPAWGSHSSYWRHWTWITGAYPDPESRPSQTKNPRSNSTGRFALASCFCRVAKKQVWDAGRLTCRAWHTAHFLPHITQAIKFHNP